MPRTTVVIVDYSDSTAVTDVTSTVSLVLSRSTASTASNMVSGIPSPQQQQPSVLPTNPASPDNNGSGANGVNGGGSEYGTLLPSGLIAIYVVIGLACLVVVCLITCSLGRARTRHQARQQQDEANAMQMQQVAQPEGPKTIPPELLARFELRTYESKDPFWHDPQTLYFARKDSGKETDDSITATTQNNEADKTSTDSLQPLSITVPPRSCSLPMQSQHFAMSPSPGAPIRRNASAVDRILSSLSLTAHRTTRISPHVQLEQGDYFSLPKTSPGASLGMSPLRTPFSDPRAEGFDESSMEDADEDDLATCAICVDEFEDGDEVRLLPCGHRFHQLCIDPWLLSSSVYCPLCKSDLMQLYDSLHPMSPHEKLIVAPPSLPPAVVQVVEAEQPRRGRFAEYVRRVRLFKRRRRRRGSGGSGVGETGNGQAGHEETMVPIVGGPTLPSMVGRDAGPVAV